MDKGTKELIAVLALAGAGAVTVTLIASKMAAATVPPSTVPSTVPPGSIFISISPSELPYTGGSVYVTGMTEGIPDGSLVNVYTSLSSAPVTQAAVVNGNFSAGLVFTENSSTETETIAVDATF